MSESRDLVVNRVAVLRMIVGAMAAALPIIGVMIFFITDRDAPIEMTHLAIGAVLGVAGGFAALGLSGSLIPALPRTEENPIMAGLNRLQAATFTQCALAEGSALVAVVLAFALGMSPYVVLLSVALGAVMVLFVAWPGRSRLRTVRRLLERDGTRCPLDELA